MLGMDFVRGPMQMVLDGIAVHDLGMMMLCPRRRIV